MRGLAVATARNLFRRRPRLRTVRARDLLGSDWTCFASYFVIVVMGVFIGIQVFVRYFDDSRFESLLARMNLTV